MGNNYTPVETLKLGNLTTKLRGNEEPRWGEVTLIEYDLLFEKTCRGRIRQI